MSRRVMRVLLVAIMVVAMVPAGAGSLFAEWMDAEEIPIAIAPGGQVQADIDWPYVVYKDGRYDELLVGNEEPHIRVYNMETGVNFPVSPDNIGLWEQSNPSIYGTKVVYSDQRNYDETDCDVWMYDIKTGVETQITDAPNGQGNPFIYGDVIAWVDWRSESGYSDIWMKDLASGEETAVSPIEGANQYEPVVWENYIVWTDYRHGSWNSIYLYDIETGEETCVDQGYEIPDPYEVHYSSDPFVHDGVVVYSSYSYSSADGSQYDISLYDIESGETEIISTETQHGRWHPVTRDGWVTWHDRRAGGNTNQTEVWGYDLASQEETRLVGHELYDDETGWFQYAGRSTTGDGWVIWHDHRPFDGDDDNADLYAKYIGPARASIPVEGTSRYATAVSASVEAYPAGLNAAGAKTVVIATGRNWPDALGGSALAGALDGPILLVTPTSVSDIVLDEIERLGAEEAIIVGGELAVGESVFDALEDVLGAGMVERVAGNNRYTTADAVALRTIEVLAAGPGYDGTAFVATGAAYADAVAAGPLAASQGWPLFLAAPGGLRAATLASMTDVTDALVLGGTAAVSADVFDVLVGELGAGNVERLEGTSRYGTAAAIATFAVDEALLGWDRVGIATGQSYPDALAGGVLQGKKGSVMLLTRSASLPAETSAALVANKDQIATVTFFGGLSAVSQTVRTAAIQAIE